MAKEVKVVQIGWAEENMFAPIILIDRATRNTLGLAIRDVVKVKNVATQKEFIAGVQPQFKDNVGKGVTINTLLSAILGLAVENMVSIELFKQGEDHEDRGGMGGRLGNYGRDM